MTTQLTLRMTPADLEALDTARALLAGAGARHLGKTAIFRIALSEMIARRSGPLLGSKSHE